MGLTFEIDGKEARPFKEYRGLQIQLNFEGENTVSVLGGSEVIQGELSNTQFTYAHENADSLNNELVLGSLGPFWGKPLIIKKDGTTILDAFIDLTNNATFSCEKVTANIKERKQKDWLNDFADSFDFRYLESLGYLSSSDFVKIPYVISEIPNYRDALILSLASFSLFVELQRTVKDLVNILSDLAGVFSTIAGVLKLIYFIVYLGLLVYAIVKLIGQLTQLFIQPIKYHYAMSYLKHWEAGCAYLGYTFSSSFFQTGVPTNSRDVNGNVIASGLWAGRVWMPVKTKRGAYRNNNPSEKGYYEGCFGDWIRDQIKEFNGKIFIIGNTLHFERKDYKSSTTSYKIPDLKHTSFGVNTDELKATYLYEFAVDQLDKNTIVNYDGTNVKAVIAPIRQGVSGANLMKGLEEILPSCCLGRRKNTLTEIEELFLDVFKVLEPIVNTIYSIANSIVRTVGSVVRSINKIIKALNKLPGVNIRLLTEPRADFPKIDLTARITDRIGMLLLSEDITGRPKALLIEGSGFDVKIRSDAQTVLSAETHWNLYYYINSFVPTPGKPLANQYYIWSMKNVPFCKEDLDLIRGANSDGEAEVISPEGNPARLKSILWNPWTDLADIIYYENKLYTDNLTYRLQKNSGT